jgi:pimeloyl-ACP methyl ester carboxylesterase
MADWPRDVAELADALEIDRFLVAGHSSGGPYAVACAALLGRRVLGGVVVAGPTDMAWDGAWDGYLEEEAAVMRAPDEAAALAYCVTRFGVDGRGFLESPFDFPEPDQPVLADEQFGQAFVESLRQGVGGYAQDAFVQGRPWPFDPKRIEAPFVVLHGERDTVVSIEHSRHTAALVPRATLRTYPQHGHLSILSELPAVAASLAASAE